MSRPTVAVPEDVLMHLTHGMIESTAVLALQVWDGPGSVARFGDPFGLVLAWLWKTDPDRAVDFFNATLDQIRRLTPGATKTFTLNDALKGLRLDLQGLDNENETALIERLRRDVPTMSFGDPNSMS
jgi:hypothetical protein